MIDKVATGSYILAMYIGVKEAKNQLPELMRRVEAGERITITRNGDSVIDLVKHVPKSVALDWKAVEAFRKKMGLEKTLGELPVGFDEPLAEEVLLMPFPSSEEPK